MQPPRGPESPSRGHVGGTAQVLSCTGKVTGLRSPLPQRLVTGTRERKLVSFGFMPRRAVGAPDLEDHCDEVSSLFVDRGYSLKAIATTFGTSVYIVRKHVNLHKLVRPKRHYVVYSQVICEACGVSFVPTSGRSRVCKICCPTRRAAARWDKYGLTFPRHVLFWERQRGCCAICEKVLSWNTHNVDHDHVTGKVRGLLCNRCNIALGWLGDTLESLARVQAYLARANA